ncbi:PEP-CTERM sorting domain-containing protein [Roseococcus sp. SYP-B2431]|uniref:PEP-CTERM sorting domain-containing protein n=1 Tax=Roseococcus sp. SYP-B2431 TaxID=2496640 RepID=UPI0013F3CECE|nr:PEP-CTERM sorting domain-containing protein [Roseococcus sp. SYP-B2431]
MILTFQQSGPLVQNSTPLDPPTPRSGLLGLTLVLTDEAFAAGVNLRQTQGQFGEVSWLLDGLVQVYVSIYDVTDAFSADIWNFRSASTRTAPKNSRIDLTSGAGSFPSGLVHYQYSNAIDLFFTLNGTNVVSGIVTGDFTCFRGCTFGGTLVQSVPEPASILTFGVGLLALGGAIRRRRAA